MVNFAAHKVIGGLPTQLIPNALYFVRTGAGFEPYVTDVTGATAHPLNTAPVFAAPPDLQGVTEDYFYFGWEALNGGWETRRQTRATGATLSARQANNPTHTTLTTAWPLRETLTY